MSPQICFIHIPQHWGESFVEAIEDYIEIGHGNTETTQRLYEMIEEYLLFRLESGAGRSTDWNSRDVLKEVMQRHGSFLIPYGLLHRYLDKLYDIIAVPLNAIQRTSSMEISITPAIHPEGLLFRGVNVLYWSRSGI